LSINTTIHRFLGNQIESAGNTEADPAEELPPTKLRVQILIDTAVNKKSDQYATKA
jgi:hypothetical protein